MAVEVGTPVRRAIAGKDMSCQIRRMRTSRWAAGRSRMAAARPKTAVESPAAEFEWQTATPESQGMSSEGLGSLKDTLASRNTKGRNFASISRMRGKIPISR